jgi:S-DNA-T family DNA segregation ATPase FtsK/SpoIIIE
MLVGGTTGSGKTTFVKSLLRQFASMDPAAVDAVIIDGKREMDYWGALPKSHFATQFPEVLSGHQHAPAVLDWVVDTEIPRRRDAMLSLARKASGAPPTARQMFYQSLAAGRPVQPFPALIIVIDEFAEIMAAGRSGAASFERRVQQVTQVGRSVLVHLILATQRPDASIVRGAIKANLDARVALRLPTHHDSMTILGGKGAERLLGRGDLIFQAAGQPALRLQGYSV